MKKKLKEKVLVDVRIQKEQERQRKIKQEKKFREKYDNPKVFEFLSPDKINMERHFYCPKGFVSLTYFSVDRWGFEFCTNNRLSLPAIAVYPVLCSLADHVSNEWFQISRENIAKMSGLSHKTVDKGLENLTHLKLADDPLLEREKRTEGKRHYYVYKVGFVRKDMIAVNKGNYFIFHTCIIDSGIWAQLSPRAKALYLAFRTKAKFEAEFYADFYDISLSELLPIYNEDYKDRKWDVCRTSLAELCRMVGIESSNIKEALGQLEYHRLIEYNESHSKIYLIPKI